jgi:hypothetical protein
MTKSENRAAAKAHAEERERQRAEVARLEAIKADLEQLAALRDYLIFRKRSREPAEELIKAISAPFALPQPLDGPEIGTLTTATRPAALGVFYAIPAT